MGTRASGKRTDCLALTGATGFIGQHVLDMALEAGWTVRALTRRDSKSRKGVTWIPGDLQDSASLENLVSGADAILHVAGATRARHRTAFLDANPGGTNNLLEAIKAAGVSADTQPHFIYLSSLAARHPELSDYADSKAQAELRVRLEDGLACTIVRPPAVYGPGDKELLRLFRFWARGVAPVFSKDARLSLIHVRDLARCLLALARREAAFGKLYEVSDGQENGYAMQDVAAAAGKVLKRPVRTVRLPKLVLRLMGLGGTIFAPFLAHPPMLTHKKVREILHPDWVARDDAFPPAKLWQPQIPLAEGFGETLDWYRARNLL